jgi:flagellar biosynthesis protein FlhG
VVDADLGLANADILLGVSPEFTLQDAIFGGKPFKDVVTETPYGVDLLAASSGSQEMVSMGSMRMGSIIRDLISFAASYDVLLFDCAAGNR